MRTVVTAQGMDMPIGFKDQVDEKSARLDKTAPDGSELSVVLLGRNNPSRGKESAFRIKARVSGKNVDETVKTEGRTPNAALDKAVDLLQRAIRHAKERRVDSKAVPMDQFATGLADSDDIAEI